MVRGLRVLKHEEEMKNLLGGLIIFPCYLKRNRKENLTNQNFIAYYFKVLGYNSIVANLRSCVMEVKNWSWWSQSSKGNVRIFQPEPCSKHWNIYKEKKIRNLINLQDLMTVPINVIIINNDLNSGLLPPYDPPTTIDGDLSAEYFFLMCKSTSA